MTSSQISAFQPALGFGFVAVNWQEYLLAIVESQDMAALETLLMPYQPQLLQQDDYRELLRLRVSDLAVRISAFIAQSAGLTS